MTVAELFSPFDGVQISGASQTEISGIVLDSRKVEKGDLFVALSGKNSDGKQFINDALKDGATAIAAEEEVGISSVPVIRWDGLRRHLGEISSRIYGDPSLKMAVIGVTGTNGKTTTALLLEALFEAGYIGTLAYRWMGHQEEAPRTTPEAPVIQKMLQKMTHAGAKVVVMECSSHGIELRRLNGVALDVALFTNLTQDHLDFHGTMENYRLAKEKLFSEVLSLSSKTKKVAVLNIDDPVGEAWAKNLNVPVLTYAVRNTKAEVRPKNVTLAADGISADIIFRGDVVSLRSPLIGEHNLYNLLAAFCAATSLGVSPQEVSIRLGRISKIPGRLERVENRLGIHVLVDYAHTDDALKNVLKALLPLKTQRMIVVFGCGGDRDRTKRPKMAKVVNDMADVTVITSDNPRSENPAEIIREIEAGISIPSKGKVFSIVDRKKAIEKSLQISEPGDIVLIAGKGHETYQEINGVQYPFDDREVARDFLEKRAA